jgi:hypothetical protein
LTNFPKYSATDVGAAPIDHTHDANDIKNLPSIGGDFLRIFVENDIYYLDDLFETGLYIGYFYQGPNSYGGQGRCLVTTDSLGVTSQVFLPLGDSTALMSLFTLHAREIIENGDYGNWLPLWADNDYYSQ